MDKQIHTLSNDDRPPRFVDLEGDIQDIYRIAHIACELVSDLLESGKKTGDGRYSEFTFSDDQIGDALFMTCEAQHRARLLREQFYTTVEAGRAA